MTVPVITESSVFLDFCDAINKEKPAFMTVDTEFARQSTYYPELCLVQIATLNQAAIIDPLAKNMDLSPLKEIFQNHYSYLISKLNKTKNISSLRYKTRSV